MRMIPGSLKSTEKTWLTANSPSTTQNQEDDPIIDIDLSSVSDPLQEQRETLTNFTDNWDETLREVLYSPFRSISDALLNISVEILTTTPSVHPNEAVQEIHGQAFIVVLMLSTLGFAAAGILYMIGPVLGISYAQVRLILPRIFIAVAFAAISLPLLQLTVDITDALVHAFKPELFEQSFTELLGLGTGLVLAWVIQSMLLVAVMAIMIMRMIYIMFVAAISPLLALMWSLPRVRRYADTFIAGYFAALLVAPLNLLVLRFSLAMMDGQGTTVLESASNWILGIPSLVLLLLVPYQLWGASQTIVGRATKAVRSTRNTQKQQEFDLDEDEQRRLQSYRRRKQAEKMKGGQ